MLINASEADNAKADVIELYNLATDLGEKTNLAAEEPERTAQMRAKLEGERIGT